MRDSEIYCPAAGFAMQILKKRKDYTFWRQINEKPSIILGCPGRY